MYASDLTHKKRAATVFRNLQLQIQIPKDDDELQPLTRREMRIEKCKLCAILSTQGVLISGLIGACIYGYYTIIMSTV